MIRERVKFFPYMYKSVFLNRNAKSLAFLHENLFLRCIPLVAMLVKSYTCDKILNYKYIVLI